MAISILNNIPALAAENQLSMTQANLNQTLEQLASGSRINTGADDAAGLAIADGLQANVTALTQSALNANEGVGKLQVADGALSQVNSLLTRAVTLATEASNGTLSTTQDAAANQEYQSIVAEIGNIGASTTFNAQTVFGTAGAGLTIYTGDSTTAGASTDTLKIAALSSVSIGDVGGTISSTATTAGRASRIRSSPSASAARMPVSPPYFVKVRSSIASTMEDGTQGAGGSRRNRKS